MIIGSGYTAALPSTTRLAMQVMRCGRNGRGSRRSMMHVRASTNGGNAQNSGRGTLQRYSSTRITTTVARFISAIAQRRGGSMNKPSIVQLKETHEKTRKQPLQLEALIKNAADLQTKIFPDLNWI